MKMAYRERWRAEIAALRKILSGFDLREERKWGKPCYTMNGRNVVIIQGFKEYCALGFFQGALLSDPKKLLVQLGQVRAARVMKFAGTQEIAARTTTIKAYLREAIAAEKAGRKVETKPRALPMPRRVEGKVPQGPALQARIPGADTRPAARLSVSLHRREAICDKGGADRKGGGGDFRRPRIPGAAIDREAGNVHRETAVRPPLTPTRSCFTRSEPDKISVSRRLKRISTDAYTDNYSCC